MSRYRLIYLNLPGRAEVARYLFAMAGVEYQDVRMDRETMVRSRHTLPFGQVPVLEVDGRAICQSKAIERYLAQQFGFDGKDDWEQARAAMVAGCCDDSTFGHMSTLIFESDPEKKKRNRDTYNKKMLPVYMKNFDRMLAENSHASDGFFVGNKLTYADVSFYFHTGKPMLSSLGASVDWSEWPRLQRVRDVARSHPGVQRWDSSKRSPSGDG